MADLAPGGSFTRALACFVVLQGCAGGALAATNGVYHPYVNQGERELEYGISLRGMSRSFQRVSIGYAWTDRLATELYLLSESPSHGGSRARAFEFEARWQLTEQGEYAADWGLIFEAASNYDGQQHEVAAGILMEKELGHRWVATANALLEFEFGEDLANEFETAFRGQLRYLRSPAFEPAFEIYLDDLDYAAGPAAMGAIRLAPGRQLRWELGYLFGINAATPDTSLRAAIEFEF